MSTPTYQGSSQPTSDNGGGWFGRVGSFFGGDAPAYQPAPVAKAPEKAPAPSPDPVTTGSGCDAEPIECGRIAIIVPRQGCVSDGCGDASLSTP